MVVGILVAGLANACFAIMQPKKVTRQFEGTLARIALAGIVVANIGVIYRLHPPFIVQSIGQNVTRSIGHSSSVIRHSSFVICNS